MDGITGQLGLGNIKEEGDDLGTGNFIGGRLGVLDKPHLGQTTLGVMQGSKHVLLTGTSIQKTPLKHIFVDD